MEVTPSGLQPLAARVTGRVSIGSVYRKRRCVTVMTTVGTDQMSRIHTLGVQVSTTVSR